MRNIFIVWLCMISCIAKAQNATPVEGYENFVNRLFSEVVIPEEVYNTKETVLRIYVDSLANAKLLLIKPYNKDLFVEVRKFVEQTKWIAAVENGNTKKSVLQIPLIFKSDEDIQNAEATPAISMMEFYKYFGKRLKINSYKQSKLVCDAKFRVKEDGSLELISITENNAELFNELKKLFAEADKWNPALKNGKPVASVKNFKLTINK
mgnify:CR=1 FL=1